MSKASGARIEQVHTLDGHELSEAWSSGAVKQLPGPDTTDETRSFFCKVENGPSVKIDAIVADNRKLFFKYVEF